MNRNEFGFEYANRQLEFIYFISVNLPLFDFDLWGVPCQRFISTNYQTRETRDVRRGVYAEQFRMDSFAYDDTKRILSPPFASRKRSTSEPCPHLAKLC
jgi:hypothetical protein